MIPSINPASDIFLADLEQVQSRISKDNQQLSSGLRVQVASDAPDQISAILQLRAQISGVQQTQQNLAAVGPLVNSGESAIEQAIQLLDNATSLGAQGASSTADASQRAQIAPQVQALLEQMVGLSQTAVGGRYVFSGDQDQQAAYTLDPTSGNGVQQMIQPGAPGQIEDANGVPFAVGLTAQAIFDDRNADGSYAPDNVFAALNGLLTDLQNPNSTTTNIQQDITNIKVAAAHLNDQASFYGSAQNRITAANNSASQTITNLQQQLSAAQDADSVQATLDLNSALTAQQAALAAEAQVKPQNLFTYLG